MTDSRPIAIGGPSIRVKVTQHDIDWGVRGDSSRCMVAKALAREVEDATRIEVDTQTIRFSTADKRYAYLTPLRVQNYLAAFDGGNPRESFEPFEFGIRNPMQIRRRVLTPEERAENRLRQLTESASSGVRARRTTRQAGLLQAKFDKEGIASPPRVFKTKKRTYGARLLRINQPMQATALDESPAT